MSDNLKDFVHRHHRGLLVSFAVVAVIAVVAGSGMSVADFSAVAERYGNDATKYLDATGFPHATQKRVETYQFVVKGHETDRVTFQVAWDAGNVTVIEREVGDADMTMRLPEPTYNEIVARIGAVQSGSLISPKSEGKTALSILTASDVDIVDRNGFGDGLWKFRLSLWGTAIVIKGDDGLRVA